MIKEDKLLIQNQGPVCSRPGTDSRASWAASATYH